MLHVANCVRCCREFQKVRNGKEPFGVGADVMGKYEESSFMTVVGNKEIHLVMKVKEKWKRQLGQISDKVSWK